VTLGRTTPDRAMPDYRSLSLWHDTVDDDLKPRDPLPGDRDADVAIVGAGYTGLWTAYYLSRLDPSLRIVVLEREIAGFGASGRNVGWCSALFPASADWLAKHHGSESAAAMTRAMLATVDEVGAVTAEEGIDCHFTKGGFVELARNRAQLTRVEAEVEAARGRGFGEEYLALLSAGEVAARVRATRVLGGAYTPHCAAIHPSRLARGLARAVEARGVAVCEQTTVRAIRPRTVATDRGQVRAEVVVRATEGYTAELPGHRRSVVPVYSLMIATEPLPDAVLEEIGLAERETFNDARHMVIYGQRTADGRIAFGGRGAPYHFASKIVPGQDREPAVFAALRRTLVDIFPVLREATITHQWGGPLGITRDWCASVGLDHRTGLAWAGGYVGDGVGTANLAGRTLADLVLGRDTQVVHLPWVGHRSRRWEPEPLRWLGVMGSLKVMGGADAEEARTGRPSRRAEAMWRLLGR
jgi:glycine/D-amino acid oxidase-like deaminating enzyme